MAARKRSATKRSTRKQTSRSRNPLDETLRQLQTQLPPNARKLVQDLRKNLKTLQKQLDQARADGEARWRKLEHQVRRDAARLIHRIEKAVAPPARKRAPARKAATRRKTASRKTAPTG